ncbi:hypothetical protein E2C01_063501 [Portunus trituberculatus]|uniref:Uncharacterized protein n=1 Tax=Portunus trituberculatus TaxID=210409 RepID=A0A5B7HGJ2_PORTR|nr:hypothetical protein [Portunus trituberculatus]
MSPDKFPCTLPNTTPVLMQDSDLEVEENLAVDDDILDPDLPLDELLQSDDDESQPHTETTTFKRKG